MLDERIEAYREIGNADGIYFICRHLSSGINDKEALYHLRLHHVGCLSINIDAALFLMSILRQEYSEEFEELLSSTSTIDATASLKLFSQILIKYLISNDVIRCEYLKYDELKNRFFIPKNGIRLRHAPFRNLLLSLGVLLKRNTGGFYYNGNIKEIQNIAVKKRHKKTLKELEDSLEKQRAEGLKGELFVLQYEQRRLAGHTNIREIQQISEIDVAAGYDIVSFEDINSLSIDRFIEVKTYSGKPHFYWSQNERHVASCKGSHYYIYLINIDKIQDDSYSPLMVKNPINFFQDNIDWKSTVDTLYLEEI